MKETAIPERAVTLDDLDQHYATCTRCRTYDVALIWGYDPTNNGDGDYGDCDGMQALHAALDAQYGSSGGARG